MGSCLLGKGGTAVAMFCKELTPTKTKQIMNRARKELHKLEKVIKSKQLIVKKGRSVTDQGDNMNKVTVDVSSLIKAKKNEIKKMFISEENDLELSKQKLKKKKKRSKNKEVVDSELSNKLSLGLHVNIELANSTTENHDMSLNSSQVKTLVMKQATQDSALWVKETANNSVMTRKKTKELKQIEEDSFNGTFSQKLFKTNKKTDKITENVEESKINLNISGSILKSGKRKMHTETTNEVEDSAEDIKRHKKRKSKRESLLTDEAGTEKQHKSKRHKTDATSSNFDNSNSGIEDVKQKMHKHKSLANAQNEHKSKKKKKKHKDCLDKSVHECQSKKKQHKHKKDKEDLLNSNSIDMIKEKKKKRENSLEMYSSESEKKCNANMEKADESQIVDSESHRKKKKKKQKEKEAGTAEIFSKELEKQTNGEETNCDTSVSPTKRKHKKHTEDDLELPIQHEEICDKKKKKKKETAEDISDKQRKKKHRGSGLVESPGQAELRKNKKERKSTDELMQNVTDLSESNKKHRHKDEVSSIKHKKKKRRDADCLTEDLQEINTEKVSSISSGEGRKRKKELSTSCNERIERYNGAVDGEQEREEMSDVFCSTGKSKRKEPKGNMENTVLSSPKEDGQVKKKKHTQHKNIEIGLAMDDRNAEVHSELHASLSTPSTSNENTIFGRSPMERLLHGDSIGNETCQHCSHNVVTSASFPSVTNVLVVKQDGSREKPCIVENIVSTVIVKKEPGLEMESCSMQVTEPINFIDVNSIQIKQEPGLETETQPDQAADPIEVKVQCIKQEPNIENPSFVNTLVPSNTAASTVETRKQIAMLKQENFVEAQSSQCCDIVANAPTMGSVVHEDSHAEPETDAYLDSVISSNADDSNFFRHAQSLTQETMTNALESRNMCFTSAVTNKQSVENSLTQTVPLGNSADNAEAGTSTSVQNVSNTHHHCCVSKPGMTADEVPARPESAPAQFRAEMLKEEWIYELHMIDVPYKVHFQQIANYFRVPVSKVREYPGYGRRPGFKHVVVSSNDYETCLRMSKRRRLFGSRHTFIWSFKKYIAKDS